jgi:hypothetical protein
MTRGVEKVLYLRGRMRMRFSHNAEYSILQEKKQSQKNKKQKNKKNKNKKTRAKRQSFRSCFFCYPSTD